LREYFALSGLRDLNLSRTQGSGFAFTLGCGYNVPSGLNTIPIVGENRRNPSRNHIPAQRRYGVPTTRTAFFMYRSIKDFQNMWQFETESTFACFRNLTDRSLAQRGASYENPLP
jgi:hypothetical protein